ncbi:hypothetical protein DFP72DRAFT_1077227 [Ephemerocybe angulata]|uniref:Uncharacterized protein n=1 Tax=Ephemerocybe angulata TaxID=980116 RepID=A0A8H6HER2_9AGAR|nr:hypothetical protein DFP72DRAFT_1077227 [Tulosesus angulatus]
MLDRYRPDMDPFVVISFGKKVFRTSVVRPSRNPSATRSSSSMSGTTSILDSSRHRPLPPSHPTASPFRPPNIRRHVEERRRSSGPITSSHILPSNCVLLLANTPSSTPCRSMRRLGDTLSSMRESARMSALHAGLIHSLPFDATAWRRALLDVGECVDAHNAIPAASRARL